MNKTKLIIVLLTSLALGACSNSDDDELTPQQPKSYPMTIEVAENPMVQVGKAESRPTRAAITTTSTFTRFNMDYKYSSTGSDGTSPETATKVLEGKWSGGSWPGDAVSSNAEVTWYAYTGGTFNLNGGTPYIDFTVDENATTQKDLLVATASGTYSGTGGKLSFTFDHACSALRFYVKKSTNINDKTLTVSSIVLKNVIKDGKYYYGTQSWTLGTTSTNYTLLSSSQTLASDSYVLLNGSEDDSYLFLIPQTLTAWNPSGALSNTYLEVTCTITNTSTSTQVYSGTAYIPFAATFEKGTKYDVKINIGKNSLYNSPNNKIIP
jgi:hypothetical protein